MIFYFFGLLSFWIYYFEEYEREKERLKKIDFIIDMKINKENGLGICYLDVLS